MDSDTVTDNNNNRTFSFKKKNLSAFVRICSLTCVIIFFGCDDSGTAPIEVKQHFNFAGFSYTSFDSGGFGKGRSINAVADLKSQIGNNWIALIVFEFQSSAASNDIAPNFSGINPVNGSSWYMTSTENDINAAIEDSRTSGMKILLKPHVDLYSGEWRASIQPDNEGKWFSSYKKMLVKYAQLAESKNIEALCIGTELVTATQSKYSSYWNEIIDTVKKVYSGTLTYSSNWNGAPSFGINIPEYEQIQFWQLLDYIGIDGYFPVAEEGYVTIPTESAADAMLAQYVARIHSFAKNKNKQFIITEIGVQSAKGALSKPWDYSVGSGPSAISDTAAQNFYYNFVIKNFGDNPLCAGMFWWHWESVISANERTNYTPRNKPAAKTVKQFYQRKNLIF